ncbi:biotin attachment protein [Sphingobacteriales bacterium UPWRP_1]|nr:biotin attachment protein [Sphingobacteriales bacterium UPWRP_1]
MLNISDNRIDKRVDITRYTSFAQTKTWGGNRALAYWLVGFLCLFIVTMFLPWTQNIRAKGKVTTLKPEHRPQTIQTTIAGRIEKWYVQEGQLVKKGDTIVYISEIKDDYFDPQLLSRTAMQVEAKESSIGSYADKARALENQVKALTENRDFKLSQTKNKIRQTELKIQSDSIELEAAKTNYTVAKQQYDRQQELYNKGLASLTDLEQRQLKFQEALAKQISAENKFLTSRNELLNARIELNAIESEYADKIAKAQSDRFSTLSALYDAEGGVAKLQNQYANYSVRSQFYYILAPQDCYITKAIKTGIGETVKEGDDVVSIMPANYQLAVEMYIRPMDLPLIKVNEKVRFLFDGWPAFVFSGWPGVSFGTFGGRVVAIDNITSENDLYRILVAPDPQEQAWPAPLRVGSGAEGLALLNDVPLWYEFWRQLNGFPPEYYDSDASKLPKLKPPKRAIAK